MMEKENEKNSSIKAGELSDDDLGSVAGGVQQFATDDGMNVKWEDDDEVKITLKNGVYTIRNITTGKTFTFTP